MLVRAAMGGLLLLATVGPTGCGDGTKGGEKKVPAAPPPPQRRALTFEDYAELCRGKVEPFSASPMPTREGSTANEVVMFTRWGAEAEYRLRPVEDLAPWHPEQPGDVSLVVCLTREPGAVDHACSMESRGGATSTLSMVDTKNTVTIVAAKTGEPLAKRQFELLGSLECPTSLVTSGGDGSYSAEPVEHVLAMVQELQPKDAPPPAGRRVLSEEACAGVPLRGSRPYDRESKEERFFTKSYRPQGEGFPTVSSMPSGLDEATLVGSTTEESERSLAVCITGIPKAMGRDCRLPGGKVVEIHDGEYEVVVREALTGAVVERKTFAAAGGKCPVSHGFRTGEDVAVVLGDPEPGLREYLEGLAKPK